MDSGDFDTNGDGDVDDDDTNSEVVDGNLVCHTEWDGDIVLVGVSSFHTYQLLF